MAQFKVATLEVYNLDESIAILIMKRGLRTFHFMYLLDKTHLKSYLEVLAHA